MKLHTVIIIALMLMVTVPVHGNTARETASNSMFKDNLLWYNPVELTWLGSAEHPQIAWDNGTYNLVWQDSRNGNWDIYYLKLTPWGFKMVNDTRITAYAGNDTNPDLAVHGDYIYIVWQRFINEHWSIYFARLYYSNKNISIDIAPRPVAAPGFNCTNPRIAIGPYGYIHLVWQQEENGTWRIMYERLNTQGARVFSPITVSALGNSTMPEITVTPDGEIEIVWLAYSITPGYGLMYRGLNCNGLMTPIRRISVVSPGTRISISYNTNLQVVFSDKRANKSHEIIYTELNSTGITLIDDTNLTSISDINASSPAVISRNNRMFITWVNNPGGLQFGEYSYTGAPLVTPYQIGEGNASAPVIAVGEKTLGVVWTAHANNATYLLMRSARIPDLKVLSLHATQTGTNISVNVTAESTLANISTVYTLLIDGHSVINGTATISANTALNFTIPAGGGAHQIEFVLNPEHKIYESNYSNNALKTEIYVKVSAYTVTAQTNYYMINNITNISIAITNTGNWNDSYEIRVSNISFALACAPASENITLAPEKTGFANFTVTPAGDIERGNYTISFNITSGSNISKNLTVTVHVLPRAMFVLHYLQMQYVKPGQKVTAYMQITNTGNCNDTYTMLYNSSAPWPASASNDTVRVAPGQTANLSISVTVPACIPAFEKNYLFIYVHSSINNITENATIGLIVEPVHDAQIYVLASEYVEGAYNLNVQILNTGNIADLYSFSVSGELSNYTTLNEYSTIIPMEGTVNVSVVINIPPSTTAGAHYLLFTVSVGNQSIADKQLSVSVPPVYKFSASARSASISRVEIELTINNTGNAVETVFVKPEMNVNETWYLTYDGRNYTNETYVVLRPGESVTVTITTAEKLASGDYRVTLHLASATSGNLTLPVEVHISSESGGILGWIMDNLLYIAIGAAVAVGVVLYFLKRE